MQATPANATSAPTYAQCSQALAGAGGATTTIAGPVTINKAGNGATHVAGLVIENTSTTGTQVSLDLELRGHQGAVLKRFRLTVKPSASGIALLADKDDGTGSFTEGNALSYYTLDPSLFDERCRAANGFVANVGTGGYAFTDGSGMTRGGSGNLSFSSFATAAAMEFKSSRSTANTGAGFRFWGNAGDLSAGYLLEAGDGSSTFTRRWAVAYNGRMDWFQSAAVAALGQVGMDTTTGRIQVWCSSSGGAAAAQAVAVQADVKFTTVAIAGDTSITGVGVLAEVDTSAPRSVTLPAIPTGVSDRTVDLWVVDVTGGAGSNNLTLATSASNTIRGGSSLVLNTAWAAVGLKHNGVSGAGGKWHVVANA